MPHLLHDRHEAGQILGAKLAAYQHMPHTLILAIPPGGVPVAAAVASMLDLPMDSVLVQKLHVPGYEREPVGAVAMGGVCVLNHAAVQQLQIPDQLIDAAAAAAHQELTQREHYYRAGRPPPILGRQTVILIDDDLITGWTLRAAAAAVRTQQPDPIVAAIPIAAAHARAALGGAIDEWVAALMPESDAPIDHWYRQRAPVSDDEVRAILERAARTQPLQRDQSIPAAGEQRAGE